MPSDPDCCCHHLTEQQTFLDVCRDCWHRNHRMCERVLAVARRTEQGDTDDQQQ